MINVREKKGLSADIKMILLLALPTIIEQALADHRAVCRYGYGWTTWWMHRRLSA